MSALDECIKDTEGNWPTGIDTQAARSELQQLRATQIALSNLLAVIHQDGGQHEQQYGAVESACAAERIVVELRADLATAQERIAELTLPLRLCPLCTWRGPVELVNGVCPQCDVDWPAEYNRYNDALSVAVKRIAAQDAAIDQARELLTTLDWNDWNDRADAWLAANAQAPEESTSQQLAPGMLCACSCHVYSEPLAVTLVDGEPLCRLCSDLRYEVPPLPASEAQA